MSFSVFWLLLFECTIPYIYCLMCSVSGHVVHRDQRMHLRKSVIRIGKATVSFANRNQDRHAAGKGKIQNLTLLCCAGLTDMHMLLGI